MHSNSSKVIEDLKNTYINSIKAKDQDIEYLIQHKNQLYEENLALKSEIQKLTQ